MLPCISRFVHAGHGHRPQGCWSAAVFAFACTNNQSAAAASLLLAPSQGSTKRIHHHTQIRQLTSHPNDESIIQPPTILLSGAKKGKERSRDGITNDLVLRLTSTMNACQRHTFICSPIDVIGNTGMLETQPSITTHPSACRQAVALDAIPPPPNIMPTTCIRRVKIVLSLKHSPPHALYLPTIYPGPVYSATPRFPSCPRAPLEQRAGTQV